MYHQFNDEPEDLRDFFAEQDTPIEHQEMLYHIQSGTAEPGTTITLTLYDKEGHTLGSQMVMADTGGNWLAGFPGIRLHDVPHRVEIQQTASTYNISSPGLLNMRTYFHPTYTGMLFSSSIMTVDGIMAAMPSTVMDSMHNMNLSVFQIAWDSFYDYEFINPSINPSDLGH